MLILLTSSVNKNKGSVEFECIFILFIVSFSSWSCHSAIAFAFHYFFKPEFIVAKANMKEVIGSEYNWEGGFCYPKCHIYGGRWWWNMLAWVQLFQQLYQLNKSGILWPLSHHSFHTNQTKFSTWNFFTANKWWGTGISFSKRNSECKVDMDKYLNIHLTVIFVLGLI